MGDVQDILILISFFIEIAVLLYVEKKAWRTLYTPLNLLMLPYAIILLLSIAISGNFGFVDFYYPSILLWSIGLLIFAIPSYTFAYIIQKNQKPLNSDIADKRMPKILQYISIAIILLFALRFITMLGGANIIGSDEFGEEYCGRGLWGHLRQLLLPILMMAIYFVDKNSKYLWLIIIPIVTIALLYQVKGWVIIPCLTGIVLRLYQGKTRIKLSLLVYILLGVLVVFLGSYIMILVVAGESELDNEVIFFVFRNFIHYLTSGTLGLSVDMELGFPDTGDFDMLITQFVNIGNILTGNNEMKTPINPLFYNTGVNWTNVRTFFGTIFINTGYVGFTVYVLFLSCVMYVLKLATIKFNNIYVYVIYYFECCLLFMGWFETYSALLTTIEIPAIVLVLLLMDKLCREKPRVELECI